MNSFKSSLISLKSLMHFFLYFCIMMVFSANAKEILFVVGKTDLGSGDNAVYTTLVSQGHSVSLIKDNKVEGLDVQDKDLILISSTCEAEKVNVQLRDVAVPIIIWESELYDDMGMTGNVQGADYGYTPDVSNITIKDPAHALVGTLSGSVSVYSSNDSVSWGTPGEEAIVIASVGEGDKEKQCIFAYEPGMQMAGMNAPAIRLGFFLYDESASKITSEGLALFNAAIAWTVDIRPSSGFVSKSGDSMYDEESHINMNKADIYNAGTIEADRVEAGEILVDGNVTAAGFIGDGSQLSNLPEFQLTDGSVQFPHLSPDALTQLVSYMQTYFPQIPPPDADNDGVPDEQDNCPTLPNQNQQDSDGDGVGDACDPDIDGDQVLNANDNCLFDPNPDQTDTDGDGIGDTCDVLNDTDGDGIADATDNCPSEPNPGQEDIDEDGIGNICDEDKDGDGVLNVADNCPLLPNDDQADTDGDGVGDACDDLIDSDGDGVADDGDNCPSVVNADQVDTDEDGLGDVCDVDIDGDGIVNNEDNCPYNHNPDQMDANGDGVGDVCEGVYVSTLGDDANSGSRIDPKRTVQAAIDNAVTTGKFAVNIAMGTYTEDVTLSGGVSLYGGFNNDFMSRDPDSYETIIRSVNVRSVDGKNCNVAVFINADDDLVVDGLTIKGGYISDSYGLYIKNNSNSINVKVQNCTIDGGPGVNSYGIYIASGSDDVQISNCKVTAGNNQTSSKSYGIYSYANNTSIKNSIIDTVISDGIIVDGTGNYIYNCRIDSAGGYGIGIGRGAVIDSAKVNHTGQSGIGSIRDGTEIVIIKNSIINSSSLRHEVGCISISGADELLVDSCIIHNSPDIPNSPNSGIGFSGIKNAIVKNCLIEQIGQTGIRVYYTQNCHIDSCILRDLYQGIYLHRPSNCLISNCEVSNTTGSSIYIPGNEKVTIKSCTFFSNSSSAIDYQGTNNVFKNNLIHISGNANGIRCRAGGSIIVNNTIIGNGGSGYGIVFSPDKAALSILNNIITGTACGLYESGTNDLRDFRNNLIFNCPVLYHDNDLGADLTIQAEVNDWHNTTQSEFLLSEGNIVNDPLFVSTEDFNLQPASPAVDAGLNVSNDYYGGVIKDILDRDRPQGAGYDIGAYESH